MRTDCAKVRIIYLKFYRRHRACNWADRLSPVQSGVDPRSRHDKPEKSHKDRQADDNSRPPMGKGKRHSNTRKKQKTTTLGRPHLSPRIVGPYVKNIFTFGREWQSGATKDQHRQTSTDK